jgi:hypothetical protein
MMIPALDAFTHANSPSLPGESPASFPLAVDDAFFQCDAAVVQGTAPLPLAGEEALGSVHKAAVATQGSPLIAEDTTLAHAQRELQYFRNKAIEQDIEIFEMRALLQSGKGLSNILNLKQLLETFMAVVREKYSAVNTTVLLKDDLENAQDFYRVKAYFGLDEKFLHESGMEESIYMFKFPKNAGLLWQLIQQGNVFSVRDMQRAR